MVECRTPHLVFFLPCCGAATVVLLLVAAVRRSSVPSSEWLLGVVFLGFFCRRVAVGYFVALLIFSVHCDKAYGLVVGLRLDQHQLQSLLKALPTHWALIDCLGKFGSQIVAQSGMHAGFKARTKRCHDQSPLAL